MAQGLSVILNNLTKMPAIGLGTFLNTGAAIEAAVKAGFRSIDCAHAYLNEPEIGEALHRCIEPGVVKREELFITSKLWSADFDDVAAACQTTLYNLQLDYLDLYLVHWPVQLKKGAVLGRIKQEDLLGYNVDKVASTWMAMEELYSKGVVKAIGISNFSITKTENLLKTAKIVPAVNQVECHPYFQQPKLKEYCDRKGIILEACFPIGNPNRFRNTDVPVIIDDPVILDIAEKHQATAAQVCLSFTLHRGMAVVPKTVTPARMTENLKSTELKFDAEDMRRLRELDRNFRFFKAEIYFRKGDTVETFWDVEEDKNFHITHAWNIINVDDHFQ